MPHEIFVSYRRKDTGGYAGRLYDHLTEKFGQDGVLFDVEVEGTAEPLRDWVSRVVPHAAVVLVLMGEEWLGDRHGRRRLHEPDDIVRLEIELALRHEIPIIPVLVDGASFPSPIDLPETIKNLAGFKGYEVNNSYWEAKVEPPVAAISSVTKTHIPILRRGILKWNAWRKDSRIVSPELAFANFAGKDLEAADLSGANLQFANLSGTTLRYANLKSANLSRANLEAANLEAALLAHSNLRGANLARAVLRNAELESADLSDANLNEVDLTGASITNCWVYGVSVWNAKLEKAMQRDLLLTPNSNEKAGAITVDSIQLAVVVHILLSSGGAREIIDVLTSKVVLILGRFTSEGYAFMKALADQLRARNYLTVLFDFERPQTRNITETVSLLAHMSRFIVANVTGTKGLPPELYQIIPALPSVPVVLVSDSSERPDARIQGLLRYPWVLEPYVYTSQEVLLSTMDEAIIARAEARIKELRAEARLEQL
jgi:uncharacterized protein YjbI with pentapeptide repeats